MLRKKSAKVSCSASDNQGRFGFHHTKIPQYIEKPFEKSKQEASKAQMDFNNKIHNYNEAILDLHGLTVKESLIVLNQKTGSWKSRKPLRIITGAGNHSKGNGKLLRSSINYITSIGWVIEKDQMGNGWFDARLKNDT